MTGRIRVLRVIARMNIGGPAYHVSLLSGRLAPERFDTLLLTGAPAASEGSFEGLATRYGARLRRVPGLGPELAPLRDLRALRALVAEIRAFRPHIVHTHTAKAGALGRLAAVLARGPRPIVVHTYHGHVLTGYFGRATTAFYRAVERALARVTDRLVGVSQATVDELVALRIAPRERFTTVPLGLELDPFLAIGGRHEGERLRAELGIDPGDVLVLYAGRLVPIKRVDALLDAIAAARADGHRVRLLVLGDGELRGALERRAAALGLGLGDAALFAGFRDDLVAAVAAADIAALASANEGTPVALIEAAAGGVPAVATRVGGVADIVTPDTGRLVDAGDTAAFARALGELAGDAALRERLGAAAREHVRERFGAARLLADVEALYDALLAEREHEPCAA